MHSRTFSQIPDYMCIVGSAISLILYNIGLDELSVGNAQYIICT